MTDWQPIETAPKDGTRVLLFEDGECVVGRWCDDGVPQVGDAPGWLGILHDDSGVIGLEPSYWMPLPDPPAQPGGGSDRVVKRPMLSPGQERAMSEEDWRDCTVLGCTFEEHFNARTGQKRHRPLRVNVDDRPLLEEKGVGEWRDGPAPSGSCFSAQGAERRKR